MRSATRWPTSCVGSVRNEQIVQEEAVETVVCSAYPLNDFQRLGVSPLHVRHDERADRVVINAAPEAHMAVLVLTWLHLFTLEQVAGRDVEPAGNRLYQLIAGDEDGGPLCPVALIYSEPQLAE